MLLAELFLANPAILTVPPIRTRGFVSPGYPGFTPSETGPLDFFVVSTIHEKGPILCDRNHHSS
jgi:hypothetical protein